MYMLASNEVTLCVLEGGRREKREREREREKSERQFYGGEKVCTCKHACVHVYT